jgi:hypothetical protein
MVLKQERKILYNVSPKLSSHELAMRVVENTSVSERARLKLWLGGLLDLKALPISNVKKARQAVVLTQQHKVIFPVIRSLSKLVKTHLWDNRTQKGRFGIMGAVVGATFFGGQSAGIAALGGAIGLPLWIVLGAGGTFAGVLLEELNGKKKLKDSDIITSYKVVDED